MSRLGYELGWQGRGDCAPCKLRRGIWGTRAVPRRGLGLALWAPDVRAWGGSALTTRFVDGGELRAYHHPGWVFRLGQWVLGGCFLGAVEPPRPAAAGKCG